MNTNPVRGSASSGFGGGGAWNTIATPSFVVGGGKQATNVSAIASVALRIENHCAGHAAAVKRRWIAPAGPDTIAMGGSGRASSCLR